MPFGYAPSGPPGSFSEPRRLESVITGSFRLNRYLNNTQQSAIAESVERSQNCSNALHKKLDGKTVGTQLRHMDSIIDRYRNEKVPHWLMSKEELVELVKIP